MCLLAGHVRKQRVCVFSLQCDQDSSVLLCIQTTEPSNWPLVGHGLADEWPVIGQFAPAIGLIISDVSPSILVVRPNFSSAPVSNALAMPIILHFSLQKTARLAPPHIYIYIYDGSPVREHKLERQRPSADSWQEPRALFRTAGWCFVHLRKATRPRNAHRVHDVGGHARRVPRDARLAGHLIDGQIFHARPRCACIALGSATDVRRELPTALVARASHSGQHMDDGSAPCLETSRLAPSED